MNTSIHMIITKAAKEMADTFDQQILEFFGSEEQAKAYAHLFVIEQLPIGFSTVPAVEGNHFIYHAETEIRIRPKTLKELERDNLV